MSYAVRVLRLTSEHRLFGHITTLLIVNAAIAKAFTITAGIPLDWNVGDYANFQSTQFPQLEVRLPLVGPIEEAIIDRVPNSLEIAVGPSTDPASPRTIGSHQRLFNSIIAPVFVEFFEGNTLWLSENVNSDKSKWPEILSFARVVRNAISHSGNITIDNANAIPVSWYRLTYGPEQNKRKIIGMDLTFADLLVLMLEVSEALDQLGCPV